VVVAFRVRVLGSPADMRAAEAAAGSPRAST
jgi:hypothetical protein